VIRVAIDAAWGVSCCAECVLSMPRSAVWGQARAFRRFITLDPFHQRVELSDPRPREGVAFRLIHGVGPFRLTRVGRILKWREGYGYAFSDLSTRGVQHGFPHIYEYELSDADNGSCRVAIIVRGRWTARWIPRLVVRAWLCAVMRSARTAIRNELLSVRVAALKNASRHEE